MPVQTFQMADIRKSPAKSGSPVQQHRENIGNGEYNRFAPLLGERPLLRPRSGSTKRRLSPAHERDQVSKIPRLDANKVFDQLKVHDNLAAATKNTLTEVAAAAATFSKVDDGGIGTVIYKITQVCDGLLNMSETHKSAIIDSLKASESV